MNWTKVEALVLSVIFFLLWWQGEADFWWWWSEAMLVSGILFFGIALAYRE